MTWLRKAEPALLLAPMEGVADFPMRTLLTESPGFTHVVTEFLRISENIPPDRIFFENAPELKNNATTPSGVPIIFQLLGGDAAKLATAAGVAVRLGARAIDLNFGCPAPTVNRHDGGATLLKYPKRIFEIVNAVRESLPSDIAVSAKFRLGWDSIDPIYENASQAVLAGANWITIHGRTKVAGYKPPAFWGPIGVLNRDLPIPVVANGEIWTLDDFKRCQDETKCVHYMIGRGAIANPMLTSHIANELKFFGNSKQSLFPTDLQWKSYFRKLVELSMAQSSHENYALCRIKQWTKTASLRNPFPFYDQIKTLERLEDLLQLISA